MLAYLHHCGECPLSWCASLFLRAVKGLEEEGRVDNGRRWGGGGKEEEKEEVHWVTI